MSDDEKREALNVFVSARIKREVKQYAQRTGISLAAATSVLLDRQLRVEFPSKDDDRSNEPVA